MLSKATASSFMARAKINSNSLCSSVFLSSTAWRKILSVPDFQTLMRPILDLMADGSPRKANAIEEVIAEQFDLSPEDRMEMLSKVKRTRLMSNILWAITYLRQAKLLETPQRGINQITSRGLKYLKRAPASIRIADLDEFPESLDFRKRSSKKQEGEKISSQESTEPNATSPPDQRIGDAYAEHKAALAQDVLDIVKSMSPAFFEQLIVDLMLQLGYGGSEANSGRTLGQSGDGGVDGVINQDKLGLEKIYLQAKKWGDGTVGSKDLRDFVGALSGHGATKGVFITTSSFTKSAIDYVDRAHGYKISLINGLQLSDLMIECNLGVTTVARYDVKRIDSDYFESQD